MSDNLKTQVISVKNVFSTNEEESYISPEQRHENLTTHQISAIQFEQDQSLGQVGISAKEEEIKKQSVIKDNNVRVINPYYNYMPKFYRTEIGYARLVFILVLSLFLLVLTGSGVLISLVLTIWNNNINPWILLLLIPAIAFLAGLLAVVTNRYRSFLVEAKKINFRDEKVLSINVQKLYRRLKTSWIDVTWFSCLAYVLLLIAMLVDAIVVMFYKGPGLEKPKFADFNYPVQFGQYTYKIVFWSLVAVILVIFVNHVLTIVSNFLRAANIDNYYNYVIVDATELNDIKKKKNKRNMIIFFAVVGTVIFLTWLIIRLVLNKKKQQQVVVTTTPTTPTIPKIV